MSHVSARWVPRLLTVEEKDVRVRESRTFVRKVGRDPSYLSRIITTDETWVHYFEPDSKQASMVWKHADSPPPKKAKAVKSMGKTVRRNHMHALRKKRPDMAAQIENVVLHQDNAPSHTATNTQLDIEVLGLQQAILPPYSPDLAPLDFPQLKTFLRGTRFNDRTEISHAIQTFNRTLDRDWFMNVYENWARSHNKCIAHQAEYFEKA
ncbi:histone-lysine N-methyltransferase SETMAR-like [Mya arenaria]|uniref:histone-lysine N-methyltransferase SETMAR-like n=1 Tax=Mya arenaria TaxID=6604 RepID=UPI0022E3D3AA|nr:histone-lysine N-methyltransferase SETMAR-like [Mya arenaria]